MSDQQNIIDFLKGYHPSSPATYKIATSLLSGLSKNSLEELFPEMTISRIPTFNNYSKHWSIAGFPVANRRLSVP